MGIELGQIAKSVEGISSEPVIGANKSRVVLPFPDTTQIKYLTGCMSDESFREELGCIMTNSFRCGGVLKKSGDQCVITETGSFDKNGAYFVVIKYAELPSDIAKD